MRMFVGGLLVLVVSAVGQAQTPATYLERSQLARDTTFHGRVAVAAMVGAIGVVLESPETPDHAVRLRLAGYALREPELVARRLASVLAATVPVTATGTVVETTLTDAQLQAVIDQRWTAIAGAFLP